MGQAVNSIKIQWRMCCQNLHPFAHAGHPFHKLEHVDEFPENHYPF